MATVAEMPPPKSNKPKTDALMPGAKKTKSQNVDRHKASYQVRVPKAFKGPLEKLAELHGGEASDEVRTAVREYLQKHNLWPKTLDELGGGSAPDE